MQYPFIFASLALVLFSTVTASSNATCYTNSTLPVIDLGYTLQRASDYNSTGSFYTFSNIAYARPPLGQLRFAPPQPLAADRSIQQGTLAPKFCPQGFPNWLALVTANATNVPKSPAESEDCLYLDVYVPKKTLAASKSGQAKAPVMIWIHGGGFVLGSKTSNGGPAGLLAQEKAHEEGMIFVALNYRLGAFGFLNGPNFKSQGGIANIGLLDQRMALNWVAKQIAHFGGDVSRISLIGESGGAASIVLHQAADEAVFGKLPVQRAIYQSTASLFPPSDAVQNEIFSQFLGNSSVLNLNDARLQDTNVLQDANRRMVRNASNGYFEFSISVEDRPGSYIRKDVSRSILEDASLKGVNAMIGYNVDEGLIFSAGFRGSFADFIPQYLPNVSTEQSSYIQNTLYPPAGSAPSLPYTSERGRIDLFASEIQFDCTAYAVEQAYNDRGYAYRFSVLPGYHTQDLAYTFYNGISPNANFVPSVASALQEYIISFAITGNPNSADQIADMPVYGNGNLLNMTRNGFQVVPDPANNQRCKYWIKQ